MREYIQKLIQENQYNFGKIIKTDPTLYEIIEKQIGNSIAEKVYNYLNPTENICEYKNNKKFINVVKGYGYCGRVSTCQCYKDSVKNKAAESKIKNKNNLNNIISNTNKIVDISILKPQLIELFNGVNSKVYVRMLERRPELYSDVIIYQNTIKTRTIPETLWCIFQNDSIDNHFCKCGNYAQFNTFVKGYYTYCGLDCKEKYNDHSTKLKKFWKDNEEKKVQIVENGKATCLEKYGVENVLLYDPIKEQIKQTNLEKYGVETPFHSKEIQEKIKNNCLKIYGVDYPLKSKYIQEKARETFKKKYPDLTGPLQLARQAYIDIYGGNPFSIQYVKDKLTETRLAKYGYKHALQKHLSARTIEILENETLFKNEIAGLSLTEAAIKIGVNGTTIARRCKQYDCRDLIVKASKSSLEYRINTYLQSIGLIENIDYIRGDRSILYGLELDFYFPSYNLAIEVGSLFYHSELNANRGEYYHYNKWKECNKNNIILLQYWDCELENSWDVICSKILYMTNKHKTIIGARKITTIQQINVDVEKEFLNKNHIQGFTNSRSKCYGAFINDNLIAVMSLKIKFNNIEIIRYATDLQSVYPGLFLKIVKFTIKDNNLTNAIISTFSDNRHGNGNLYRKTGFAPISFNKPSYYYTENYHTCFHKSNFRKELIETKFNIKFNEGETEWQKMQELGYDRIWDAGKIKWQLEFKLQQ